MTDTIQNAFSEEIEKIAQSPYGEPKEGMSDSAKMTLALGAALLGAKKGGAFKSQKPLSKAQGNLEDAKAIVDIMREQMSKLPKAKKYRAPKEKVSSDHTLDELYRIRHATNQTIFVQGKSL